MISFFFLMTALVVWVPLWYYTDFRFSFSISVKNDTEIWCGFCWTDFCILILYPATLLKLFSPSTVSVFSLEFLYTKSYHLKIVSFISSLPFVSCSCLIDLARISKTILNKSSECGHSLVSCFRNSCFNFFQLSIMLVVGVSFMVFIMLRYLPPKHSDEGFNHERMLDK